MRPSGIHRIFLYDQCVGMRKSFEGLSQLIDVSYPGTLLTGALSRPDGRYNKLIAPINKCEVLILDDLLISSLSRDEQRELLM